MPFSKLMGSKGKPVARPGGLVTNIRISNPWHAVSVQCSAPACAASRDVQKSRFLATEAPKLPLVSCSNPLGCKCVYRHHDDRRAGPRRTIERGSPLRGGSFYPGEERRGTGGRRRTDD